jgi:hypothetical protein
MHDLTLPDSLPVAGTSASHAPDQTVPSQQVAEGGLPGRRHTMLV